MQKAAKYYIAMSIAKKALSGAKHTTSLIDNAEEESAGRVFDRKIINTISKQLGEKDAV